MTHRWRAQGQTRLKGKQMVVSYTNRCLARNKMWDFALHPWTQLTLAVGPTNEKSWWGGADKRVTSGRMYRPHRSDGVMGWGK